MTAAWALVAVLVVPGVLAVPGALPAAAQTVPAPASVPSLVEPAAPGSPPVVPIPIPEIEARAAEVAALLRQSDARLADDPRVQDVETHLPEVTEWIRTRLIGTMEAVQAPSSSSAMANLAESWSLTHSRLQTWSQTLTRVAVELDRELSRLEALRTTWAASPAAETAWPIPEPVVDRMEATRRAIVLVRDRVATRRAEVLILQDRVVTEIARCDDVLGKIGQARREPAVSLFARDSAPIWSAAAGAIVITDIGPRLKRSVADSIELAKQYLRGQAARAPVQLVLFIVALGLLVRARARARQWRADEPSGSRIPGVFEAPLAAALILTLLATLLIYPRPPRAVMNLVALLTLAPVVLMARHLLPPALFPAVYALGSFFLVDRVRELCADMPVLEQRVFLVEIIVGMAFLALALRSERLMTAASGRLRSGTQRMLGWIVGGHMTILAAAVIGAVLGYMQLARSLGTLVLTSSYAALVLYAGVRIGKGLSAFVLEARPAATLLLVQRHREVLERRVSQALGWLAFGTWAYLIIDGLGLVGPMGSAVGVALNARYGRGTVSLSLGDVVAFALTVWAAIVVSRCVRFLLHEEIYPRTGLALGQSYALSSLLHYAVILVGLLFAVSALGIDLNRITILAGAFGVGIGIGLQNVVANFVAGIIILLEQRLHVGDSIEAGDLQGEMREIGFRASTVRTWSGAEVIVPNSRLTSDRVTNWTLSDRKCRVDLDVPVAYTTDTARVLDVLRQAANAHPGVFTDPKPLVLCTGFRESGLTFQLRTWTRFDDAEIVRSDLALAVPSALESAGVRPGRPERDLHLWSTAVEPLGGLPEQTSRARGRDDH